MREYKSGMRWALWRWTEVRSAYIKRLHILKTPWFALCLHWIMRPDPEPYLHDHPVTFLSLILRGAYAERRHKPTHPKDNGYDLKVHRWFNFLRATPDDRHQIIYTRRNTLTLCFMGPVRRTWGYHTEDGWITWRDYEKQVKEREERSLQIIVDELHKAREQLGEEHPETQRLELVHERHLRFLAEREANRRSVVPDNIVDFEISRKKHNQIVRFDVPSEPLEVSYGDPNAFEVKP